MDDIKCTQDIQFGNMYAHKSLTGLGAKGKISPDQRRFS